MTTLVASLISLSTFSTVAAAAGPAAEEPGAVASVPEPEAGAGTIPGEGDAPAVPEPAAPTPETPAPPTDPSAEPAPSEVTAPASEPAPVPAPAVDPSLLDAKDPEDAGAGTARPVVTEPAGRSPEEQLAAMEDAYVLRYRPASNPVRLNIAGRVMFANISGHDRVNGRMGGASVDVGPSWNRVGVSGTLTGWGGRVLLPPSTGGELNALIGGGLTLSLGRLALLSHGFLDLRIGYDIYYGAVNQARSGSGALATADGQLRAVPTESLLPHGPRARLDLGLVGAGNRTYFHGFGLSMGYQALVGSFRGDLPMTSMLTIGLSYWMG